METSYYSVNFKYCSLSVSFMLLESTFGVFACRNPQVEKNIPRKPVQKVFPKPECLIKQKINTMASKNLKHDQSKLEEIARKADILSHLSEVNEADLRSDRKIIFGEKQAAMSAAAKKDTHKVLSFKHDPNVKTENTELTAPVISFRRKVGANRSLRNRRDSD